MNQSTIKNNRPRVLKPSEALDGTTPLVDGAAYWFEVRNHRGEEHKFVAQVAFINGEPVLVTRNSATPLSEAKGLVGIQEMGEFSQLRNRAMTLDRAGYPEKALAIYVQAYDMLDERGLSSRLEYAARVGRLAEEVELRGRVGLPVKYAELANYGNKVPTRLLNEAQEREERLLDKLLQDLEPESAAEAQAPTWIKRLFGGRQ